MKPTFKTTAVAILVALGISACKSTPDNSSNNRPVAVNPTNPNNNQDTGTHGNNGNTANNGNTDTNNNAGTTPNKPTLPTPITPTKPGNNQDPQARINAELAKAPTVGDNEKVKFEIRLDRYGDVKDASSKESHVYGSVSLEQQNFKLPEQYAISDIMNSSVFRLSNRVNVPLSELTEQDIRNGGTYLGEHKGTYKNENIDGMRVTELAPFKTIFASDVVAGKVNDVVREIDYLYINTPYATYGALFNGPYDAKLFYAGLGTHNTYGKPFTEQVASKTYVESLKGDLVYKGDVIAITRKAVQGTRITLQEEPKVDGKVTLNAKFEPKSVTVSGHIDSNAMGKITLDKTSSSTLAGVAPKISTSYLNARVLNDEGKNAFMGSYTAEFVGKEYSDVIGRVSLSTPYDSTGYIRDRQGNFQPGKDNPNMIREYEAVFGATKQPK